MVAKILFCVEIIASLYWLCIIAVRAAIIGKVLLLTFHLMLFPIWVLTPHLLALLQLSARLKSR